MIRSKFCEDISSNEKFFHASTWFRSFSLYGSYILMDWYLKNWETRSRIFRRMDGQTDGHGLINLPHHADHLCIYFIGSPTFPSGWHNLRGKLNIPCSGYKTSFHVLSFDPDWHKTTLHYHLAFNEFWFFWFWLIFRAPLARLLNSFDVIFKNPHLATSNAAFEMGTQLRCQASLLRLRLDVIFAKDCHALYPKH